MVEAIYERKVDINKKKLELKRKENRIRYSLKTVIPGCGRHITVVHQMVQKVDGASLRQKQGRWHKNLHTCCCPWYV